MKNINYNYAWVFYDVSEKRVNKVFKICKKYLSHFQKSVFRGDITPSKLISLRSELKSIIVGNEDFVLNKRVKRPPDNPINALISFGNTLLYTKTISAIYRTHLDQRISFLHEPSEGRFSLSLDISEVFKPIIVYKTIFDLVNNKRIQVAKHFEKSLNYCILNEEGRQIFIEAFENRIESTFLHTKLNRKISYRTAIKLDCYKLIKNILEDKEFISFSLKNSY